MGEKRKQPLYKRQRFLLEFLSQLEPGATATDLQKLVFLHIKVATLDYYDFIPYKYGPYSFQLSADLDTLCRDGFVDYCDPIYRVHNKDISSILLNLPKERGDSLIRKVYNDFPYYAINSEILPRLFKGNDIDRFRKEKSSLRKSFNLLFTIGYEGKSLETFMNLLIQNDIRLLCDVRRNPLSRKFGFTSTKLQHVLETIGIRYMHIPEVGIASEKRVGLTTNADYDALFSEYKNNLCAIEDQLVRIWKLCEEYGRVALMCYEEDPQSCHRHIIRDYLITNYGAICEDL